MRKYFSFGILSFLILSLGLFSQNLSIDRMLQSRHESDALLVRFYSTVSNAEQEMILSKLSAIRIEKLPLVENLYSVKLPAKSDLRSTLTWLSENREVMYSHPDYIVRAHKDANDTNYNLLYGLQQIKAPDAWDIATDSSIIVAVLDSGILYTHEDLADNMWINQKEKNGTAGKDDDGNGYIDDIYGYNFEGETGDPKDLGGHGTAAAGVIGAVGNNSLGVTGVCWNVKLMALKFMADEEGTTTKEVKGIAYAVANGAKVINMSFGTDAHAQAEEDAILEAKNAGVVCVCSAGNDGTDNDVTPVYPVCLTGLNVIGVGASDETGAMAALSNYGLKSVDLLAPGVKILTTYIDNTKALANDSYAEATGTSFSAPYISGCIALLWAIHPNETYGEILNRLYKTVDAVEAKGTCPVRTGGRVNLAAAATYTPDDGPDDFNKGSGGCSTHSGSNLGNLFPYIFLLAILLAKYYRVRYQN